MFSSTPSLTTNFSYIQKNYLHWLKEFAGILGSKVKDNSLTLQPDSGQGHCTAYLLEKGFSACVNNFQLNRNFLFTRKPSSQYGVIIYLYHTQSPAQLEYTIDNVAIDIGNGSHYTLRIINAQTLQQINFIKSTVVRGISIFLNNEWITKNLTHRMLEVFNYLQHVNYFKQFINARQQRLMDEILSIPGDHPYRDVYIRSRILRILDKLLENFLQRDISELPEKINEDDFNTLQSVEAILTPVL